MRLIANIPARYAQILIFLLLATHVVNLRGQTILEDVRNKVVLKWAPLTLYDYYNTLQLGVEIPIPNTRFSLQQELGYGHSKFSLWNIHEDDRPDRHHFRSRSQIRLYLKEWNSFRVFLAGEYFLRKSRSFQTRYLGMDCDGGFGCNYFKETSFSTERKIDAVHIKFGFQTWFSRRISFDAYAGLGLRSIRSRSLTPGVTGGWRDEGPWWESSSTAPGEPIPSLATGFQIGVLLGRLPAQK